MRWGKISKKFSNYFLGPLLFAWLLLGELPLPVQLLGGAFVVAGVVAVRYDELTRPDGPVEAEQASTVTLSPVEP